MRLFTTYKSLYFRAVKIENLGKFKILGIGDVTLVFKNVRQVPNLKLNLMFTKKFR